MTRSLALVALLAAALALAVTVNLQQGDSTTAVWATAQLSNERDGGMVVTLAGNIKKADGGSAVVDVPQITCYGPAGFATVTTCFQAWKDANFIP